MRRPALLRNVKKRLRMIEYYSASRPRNGWTRAMDASLFLTLVLAVPVTWICDVMASRPRLAAEFSGVLSRTETGAITADLQEISKRNISQPHALNVPIGVFRVEVIDHHHGWPLTTTVRRQPARVNLDLRIEPVPRLNAMLAMDDPIRLAIAEALTRDHQQEILRAWPAPDEMPAGRSGIEVHRNWHWWIAASGVWWLMLVFVSMMALQTIKFAATLLFAQRHARRAQLRAQGKCHTCGYDMTGLEFNERCPECGELVW
jgi:hypothetical protein